MNRRAFTLSLGMAVLAVIMAYSYIQGREAKFTENFGEKVPVVVAKEDISEFELLDDRKVTIIAVPQTYRMPGAFSKTEEIFNTIATVPIKKGEQITKPRVTFPGDRTGLARQITPGKRAFAIQISESQAVSKLIKPGDRIDILSMIDYAGGVKDKLKVQTVLQDVLVLSTGLSVTNSIPLVGMQVNKEIKTMNLNSYTNFNTITIEITPHEVQKMIFLVAAGTGIYLSLRNNDDKDIERIGGTRIYDLLGEDASEAKAYFAEKQQLERMRGGR